MNKRYTKQMIQITNKHILINKNIQITQYLGKCKRKSQQDTILYIQAKLFQSEIPSNGEDEEQE